jgi:hypothetical protein
MKNKDESLLSAISKSDAKLVASDIGELGLDSFLEDGILKDIPVLKWLQSGYNLFTSISGKMLGKKLIMFLDGASDITEEEKVKFVNSLENPKKIKKIGEQLLLILNKYDDYRKAKLLGKFYKSLVNNEINVDEFSRISAIIGQVYYDDFMEIKNMNSGFIAGKTVDNINQSVKQSFMLAGLYIQDVNVINFDSAITGRRSLNALNSNYGITTSYSLSELGVKFSKIYNTP